MNDKTTKICETCVGEVHHITLFRGVCAEKNSTMTQSERHPDCSDGDVIVEFIEIQNEDTPIEREAQNRVSSSDPPVAYISLIDDDSDSDSESDRTNAQPELTNESATNSKSNRMNLESIDFES